MQPETSASILFLTRLFACALAGQSCFYTFLFTRFQVKGVALYFFDDVFLLDFTLETAQSIFKRFTLLQPNFCQPYTPPNSSSVDCIVMSRIPL
jgi:hypothetical protein